MCWLETSLQAGGGINAIEPVKEQSLARAALSLRPVSTVPVERIIEGCQAGRVQRWISLPKACREGLRSAAPFTAPSRTGRRG